MTFSIPFPPLLLNFFIVCPSLVSVMVTIFQDHFAAEIEQMLVLNNIQCSCLNHRVFLCSVTCLLIQHVGLGAAVSHNFR